MYTKISMVMSPVLPVWDNVTKLGEIFPFGLLFAAKGFKKVAQENGYFGRYFFKWLEFFDLYDTKKDFNKPMFALIQAKFFIF